MFREPPASPPIPDGAARPEAADRGGVDLAAAQVRSDRAMLLERPLARASEASVSTSGPIGWQVLQSQNEAQDCFLMRDLLLAQNELIKGRQEQNALGVQATVAQIKASREIVDLAAKGLGSAAELGAGPMSAALAAELAMHRKRFQEVMDIYARSTEAAPNGASATPHAHEPGHSEILLGPVSMAVAGGAALSPGARRIREAMENLGERAPRTAAALGAITNASFQIEMSGAQHGAEQRSIATKQHSGTASAQHAIGGDTERMLAAIEGELARRQRDGADGEASSAKYRAIHSVNTRASALAVVNAIFVQNVQGQLAERVDVVSFTGGLDVGNSAASADQGSELAHYFDRGGALSNGVIRRVQELRDAGSRTGEMFNQSRMLTGTARVMGRDLLRSGL